MKQPEKKKGHPFKSFYRGMFAMLFVAFSLLMAVVVISIFYANFHYNMDNLADSNLQNITYARQNMESLLADVTLVTDHMFLDRTLLGLLATPENAGPNQAAFKSHFFTYKFSDPRFSCQVDLFDFHGNKYTYYNSGALAHSFFASGDVTGYPWYGAVADGGGRIVWMDGADTCPAARDLIFAARLIKNASANRPAGVAVVSFLKRRLIDGFSVHDTDTSATSLANARGMAVLSPGYLYGQGDEQVLDPAQVSGPRGYYTNLAAGRMVVYQLDARTGWYVVQRVALPTFTAFLLQMMRPMLVLMLGLTLVAGAFAYLFYRKISGPIFMLVDTMRAPNLLGLEIPELDTRREDEIGHLNRGYQRMLVDLRQMFDQLVREQEEKRNAELRALQAQINPHFLYNSLTSVRYLIQMGQHVDASSVLIALIKLMKVNLDVSRPIITVAEEIDVLDNYILIQKHRYENFHVEYQIDANCLGCELPKLLVQPLVENSLFHGLKNGAIRGTITIAFRLCDSQLQVRVRDDGQGFAAPVDLASETLNTERGSVSIGLKNVNDRLVLRYGEASGLRVESPPGGGACVSFTIPAK